MKGQYLESGKCKWGFTFHKPIQKQNRILEVDSVESAELQGRVSIVSHHLPCGGEGLVVTINDMNINRLI